MATEENIQEVDERELTDEERILAEWAKQKRRNKKRHEEQNIPLNINSMMDMMTIILTFLLKSYGSEPIQINQNDDLRLPFSTSELAPEDMMTITLSKKWVMVDDDRVIPVNNGAIDPSALQSAESAIIPELQQKIADELKNQEQWARVKGTDFKKVVTIISDSQTPFKILTQVMITATAGGIQNFKFAILQAEQGAAGGGS